jgi:hypothetical protein
MNMAYDLTRCPQTEAEFDEYFYTLTQRRKGTSAHDWKFVMTNSNIPPGFGPGVQADASYPLFGLTQQFSNGPKGRIFLPADTPDENGYYTRCIQYLDDANGSRAKAASRKNAVHSLLEEDFDKAAKSGELVWAWYWVAGHEYAPVQGADSEGEGGGDGGTIIVAGGMKPEEVQAMIDASLSAALTPINEQLAKALKIGSRVALRINSGKFAGVQGGGASEDDQPIQFITRPAAHAWETVTLEQGE